MDFINGIINRFKESTTYLGIAVGIAAAVGLVFGEVQIALFIAAAAAIILVVVPNTFWAKREINEAIAGVESEIKKARNK